MIDQKKIEQATKEIREWAKAPGRAAENPTAPKAEEVEATETVEVEAPVDIYEKTRKARREESRKQRPHGSSSFVMAVVRDAVAGADGREGLAHAYRRAKGYSDSSERGELYEQQYMEDNFLPVVEAVVNFTSPDQVLNNAEALKTLDQYVMGVGTGTGYTEAYIRQAYGDALGQQAGQSDQTVRDAVMTIKRLATNDQIRACYGMAQSIKEKIDKGEHIASDDDYALIARVVAFK